MITSRFNSEPEYTESVSRYSHNIQQQTHMCRPLLWALGLFGYSTSGRQHVTEDLSSAPPSCQSEEPLPLSVCLPTIQLYTDTQAWAHEADKCTHTHTQNPTLCWECVQMLQDYFSFLCVREADTERERGRERERECVQPFRVLRVGSPFPFLRNRNQQLTCHFCSDSHLWKAGHAHMSKVPLNRILWSQKM